MDSKIKNKTARVLEFNLDRVVAAQGISLRQAAIKAGLSYPTVQRIAANKMSGCSLLTLQKLAEALNVPVGDLFRFK